MIYYMLIVRDHMKPDDVFLMKSITDQRSERKII